MQECDSHDPGESSIRRLNGEHFMLMREIRKHNANRLSPEMKDLLDLFPGALLDRKRRFDQRSL
jgi:hypothetical protein